MKVSLHARAPIGRLVLAAVLCALAAVYVIALNSPGAARAASPGPTGTNLSLAQCRLGGPYKHVIFIQYDNTHLLRDNPSVPSDLEQIPALKNFITGNGTLDSNQHTPLISHTADDIVTTLTGMYPDRSGLPVANSYAQYSPGSGAVPTTFPSAFSYWTDPVSTSDSLPNLITDGQQNTPAPWVPFTRAGCDVGAFSIADMELENTKTSASGDITSVFGSGSPQWNFAKANSSGAGGTLAAADFEGIAIHCSQADSSNGPGHTGVCSPQNGGVADNLPDEPGGYSGFNGLFGSVYANQVTSSPGSFTSSTQDANGAANGGIDDLAAPVKDVYGYSFPGCHFCANGTNLGYNGQPITSKTITDNSGNSGFVSSFDPLPSQTLGYVAAMQEAGIPVTFAYIEDAHNAWTPPFQALGPGQPQYEDQLRQENQAYEAFFERLAADGINRHNTLFVFTADEGDHFAGDQPTGPCDGVTTPCTYPANGIGEQDVATADALSRELGDNTPFAIHFDDNPNFYVGSSNPTATAPPGPEDANVRQLEQDMGKLTLDNHLTGVTNDPATEHIADAEDQRILHMQTSDPLRTPSFTDFGNPAYFFQGPPPGGCPSTSSPGCPTVGPAFAWNHGGDEPEVTTTWLGLVGPTIRHLGETGAVWSDHTDTRPTMLATLGLRDDYVQDGAPLTQFMDRSSLSGSIDQQLGTYQSLQAAYNQLNAPVGEFAHDSEMVSTTAAESSSPGDATSIGFDAQLTACQQARDPLASTMRSMLHGAAFGGGNLKGSSELISQANTLIGDMHELSTMSTPPSSTICS